jgi:integrase
MQSLRDALRQWEQIANIGKRPRTQHYHQEIAQTILRLWPADCDAAVESVTDQVLREFVVRIGRFSGPRFNAIVSAVKAIVPAARTLKRRRVRIRDRPVLSGEGFRRLLAELDGRPRSYAGLVVRFLAHTGLRINEARQLCWADVQENFILVPAWISKSGRPRAIPFVNGIARPLEALWRVGDRKRVLPQAECKRSLQAACKLAGVPRLSHHDFRHLFATRCIESKVDLPTVARWLGHQDGGALLARVYFHLMDEHSGRMAARVRI